CPAPGRGSDPGSSSARQRCRVRAAASPGFRRRSEPFGWRPDLGDTTLRCLTRPTPTPALDMLTCPALFGPWRPVGLGLLAATLLASDPVVPSALHAQEARARWERLCRIRQDKFDLVLPEAMRENGIGMWIVVQKEGHPDPLWEDLG